MTTLTSLVYLLAAILFILGLKSLSSPRSARRGNWLAAMSMLLAVGWTIVLLWSTFTFAGLLTSLAGILIGGAVGTLGARAVKMTAIPQMVALFNGAGGGAAALVALAGLLQVANRYLNFSTGLPSVFAVAVGGMAFAGSTVAFAKLQALIPAVPITFRGQQVGNGLLALLLLAVAVFLLAITSPVPGILLLLALALLLGVGFVLPIGGADTPVVISLLNALTGLAVAASGFALHNFALIIAGTLVGASGTLLTRFMSNALGRSLAKILFGEFGRVPQVGLGAGAKAEERPVRRGSADDVGTLLAYAQKVIIIPGYGLAVAQGQHALRELADVLRQRGVEVAYAIHPVAGRMPGHMNVLLAEANVPYEQLKEMDEINPQMKQADVALVVGANDVVNPAAHNTPGSPIYGMPILDANQARSVVFLKRSTRPGFSGVENELLYDPRTIVLFGDARESLRHLATAVKAA